MSDEFRSLLIGIYTSKKKKMSIKKIAQDIVEKVSGHVGHLSTKHFHTTVIILED